jgi:hypothetical protein
MLDAGDEFIDRAGEARDFGGDGHGFLLRDRAAGVLGEKGAREPG